MKPEKRDRAVPGSGELPQALRLFAVLTISLTAVSLLLSEVARVLGWGLPYSFAYYYVPNDMFSDFTAFASKFHGFGTAAFFTHKFGQFMYPAPLALAIRPFFLVKRYGIAFGLVALALTGWLVYRFSQALRQHGFPESWRRWWVAVVVLTSYPLLFELQRLNVEIVLVALVAASVWLFASGRAYPAAAVLGLAIALKLYPFIFLGLFVARRQWRPVLLALGVATAVYTFSLAVLGPTIGAALHWNLQDLSGFGSMYGAGVWQVGYDHSFFALAKAVTLPWHPSLLHWTTPYLLLAAIGSLAVYLLRVVRLPLVNQVLVLSILSVCLPPVSYDYTLLHLYTPFLLLTLIAVQQGSAGAHANRLRACFVLFALIFTPESYVIVHGVRLGAEVRTAALVLLLVLALMREMPEISGLNGRPGRIAA